MKLLIVESPTKAKTISRFLDKNYKVESSFGHIRDLPKKEMGVDTKKDFAPKYVIPLDKRKRVLELKKIASRSDFIYYATDEDREGEAIAWHLSLLLKSKVKSQKSKVIDGRISFHEITKTAVLTALKDPHKINQDLVDAQQARRILDRLVGYELSPFLWKKVARGLSAGRVQSVALRLIVEREREIEKFKEKEYWTIIATLLHCYIAKEDKSRINNVTMPALRSNSEGGKQCNNEFTAQLYAINGKKLDKFAITTKVKAQEIYDKLKSAKYRISSIEKKEKRKNPYPPYTTSTLQQDANRRFHFSAKQTMRLAQQLYEGIDLGAKGQHGLITYMRTDSVNMSDKFLLTAQNYIKKEIGEEYALPEPRRYKTKSKSAQEAHEAIRPTAVSRSPEKIKDYLDSRQFKLYQLIWQRAVASQMAQAVIDSTRVDIETAQAVFRAVGSIIKFDGFLRVYPIKTEENILPPLEQGEKTELKELKKEQHFTQPKARYSDASLVKALEERGIGRPSTYAPTIATIEARNYAERIERRLLKPTEVGILVSDVLVKHFPQIVDYDFTAKMEGDLDEVARGKIRWQKIMKEFYFPFHKHLKEKEKKVSKKELTEEKTDEKCEKCGKPMIIKMGRFGKFLACTGFPECKTTKPILSKQEEREVEEMEKSQEKCEKCGADMKLKTGRYGPFLACSAYPKCKNIKGIEKKTGVNCPQCEKGDIVEKRSKRGRTFFACNKYPKCKFALWSKPTGDKCKKCQSLMVFGKNNTQVCSNKECK